MHMRPPGHAPCLSLAACLPVSVAGNQPVPLLVAARIVKELEHRRDEGDDEQPADDRHVDVLLVLDLCTSETKHQ